MFLALFSYTTQMKLSFPFSIPATTPISSAALQITVVITVPKCGRNSKCFCRSVGTEEDLGSWGLEESRESLADEPKHVFGVPVIY